MTSRSGRKNYIRRPDVVERIGSYLGTSFPLFHAIAAFAALQYNEAAGREVQCGDGPEFSWMDVPGTLHQPHHAPTLAILHRLINCVLRQDTASLGTLAMHLNHLAWPGTSVWASPTSTALTSTTRGGTHQPGRHGDYQEACRASLHQ